MELHEEVQLSPTAAEAIARGLYAIAMVDGMHEREAGLIGSFVSDAGLAPSELSRSAISPKELAVQLHTADERQLFLKTAVLCAYADGKVSDGERKLLGEFATALGFDKAGLDGIEALTKEFLLSQLTHLQNTDATRAVAQKLKI